MAGASRFLPSVTRLDSSLRLASATLVLRADFGCALGMVAMLVLGAEMEKDGVHVRTRKPHGLSGYSNTLQFISPGTVLRACATETYVMPSPSLLGRSCLKLHVRGSGDHMAVGAVTPLSPQVPPIL